MITVEVGRETSGEIGAAVNGRRKEPVEVLAKMVIVVASQLTEVEKLDEIEVEKHIPVDYVEPIVAMVEQSVVITLVSHFLRRSEI